MLERGRAVQPNPTPAGQPDQHSGQPLPRFVSKQDWIRSSDATPQETSGMGMIRRGVAALVWLSLVSGPAFAQSSAPLADAAEKKDRAKIAALLKQGVDVNAPQVDGMTALHWTVYHDDLQTATLLL